MQTTPKYDPMIALIQNRARLVGQKTALKTEYDQKVAEVDAQIRNIDNALDTIRAAVEPYLCPDCHGDGSRRRADAAGQMENVPCETCHGTGIKPISG